MSLVGRLRTSFVAGTILVTPLAVTLFVLQFVFLRVSRTLDPVVRATRLSTYTANSRLLAQALAAVLLAVGVTALGYVAARSVGRLSTASNAASGSCRSCGPSTSASAG